MGAATLRPVTVIGFDPELLQHGEEIAHFVGQRIA
jgi:hypothetical protein